MILYDTIFEPPAIIIPLTVAGVVRRRPQLEVSALIDTGADISQPFLTHSLKGSSSIQ